MDEGTRYSREMFVTASGITVLWDEVSHSKTIDQMRLDLVARARLQATNTNRHFAFAFASSNKDQYVEVECLRIDPDWTYRTMGNRTLNFNDQGEIIDFFFRDVQQTSSLYFNFNNCYMHCSFSSLFLFPFLSPRCYA